MIGSPDAIVRDPSRLAALRETGLLDSPPEEVFDRLTRLAVLMLGVPIALLSLVDEQRQFFKSFAGLPEPWASRRESPLSHSLCTNVVALGQSLAIGDTRTDPLVQASLAVREVGILAYAGIPLRTSSGHLIGTFCVVDTKPHAWTERELAVLRELAAAAVAEIELRSGARREATALQAAHAGVVEYDLATAVGLWSPEAEALFGLSLRTSRATLDDLYEMIHPADRERVRRALELSTPEEADPNIELRIIRKDGAVRWVSCNGQLHRDSRGLPIRAVLLLQDITLPREELAALREREARYHLLADAAAEGIASHENGIITEINERGAAILGYDREALIGTSFLEYVHREDVALVERRLGQEATGPYEHRIVRRGGGLGLVEARSRLLPLAVPPRWVLALRDVTDRRAVEQREQQAQKYESLGALAGGIAHDFNNLLTAILGNAGLARLELPPESSLHASLGQIEVAARRAADLTRQMLAYAGKGRYVVRPLNLSTLVADAVSVVVASLPAGTVITSRLEPNVPAIQGDADQLRHLFLDLVVNAREALGEPGGSITVTTGVRHADQAFLDATYLPGELVEGEYVFLEVRDDGHGMDPETQARMFDPFYTTKFTGRGLGLAAVLGIVRGHQGAILVESGVGRGTAVLVLFPRTGQVARQARGGAVPGGSGTVLVVDDESAIRDVARWMLRRAGFGVLMAGGGQEGLALFRAHRAELAAVLLDWTMPEMSGEETLRAMHELDPSVPVVLSSGYTEAEITDRIPEGALAGFLQKPYQAEQLAELLQSAARRIG